MALPWMEKEGKETGRVLTKRKEFILPVSNKVAYVRELSGPLALYLYYIDRTTEDEPAPDGTYYGIVSGGKAIWSGPANSDV